MAAGAYDHEGGAGEAADDGGVGDGEHGRRIDDEHVALLFQAVQHGGEAPVHEQLGRKAGSGRW